MSMRNGFVAAWRAQGVPTEMLSSRPSGREAGKLCPSGLLYHLPKGQPTPDMDSFFIPMLVFREGLINQKQTVMKANKLLSFIAAALAVATIPSCKKEPLNPPVEDLPGKPFSVTLEEVRDQMPITWALQEDGDFENSLQESIKIPVVTDVEGSGFILKATARVNIESSATDCIAVQAVGTSGQEYRLVYKSDGSSIIKVWNGTGEQAVEKSFRVQSKDEINVEGLWFRYGYNHRVSENPYLTEPYPFTEAQDLIVRYPLGSRPNNIATCIEDEKNGNEDRGYPTEIDFLITPYERPVWYVWIDENDHSKGDRMVRDTSGGCELEFVGLYPENCSYRRIEAFESEWDFRYSYTRQLILDGYFQEGEYRWPNVRGIDVDYSEFKGTKMWIPSDFQCYMALVKVDCPSPSYFKLAHAMEAGN